MPISELHDTKNRTFTKTINAAGITKSPKDLIIGDVCQFSAPMRWSVTSDEVKVEVGVKETEANGVFCIANELDNVAYCELGGGKNVACVGPYSGCLLRAGTKGGRQIVGHIPRSGGKVPLKDWTDFIDTDYKKASWDSNGQVDIGGGESAAYAFVEISGTSVKRCILAIGKDSKITRVILADS